MLGRWCTEMATASLTRPRAVAFDVFGTLLALQDARNPWKKIAQAGGGYAVDPRELPIGLETFAAECGVPWDPEWAEDLAAELQSIQPYEDVIDTLEALRGDGFSLALVSNLAQPYVPVVRSVLARHVDVEIYSCNVGAAKPRPRIFATLRAQLNLPPRDILVVGDSFTSDIEGARNSGMRALHLQREGPKSFGSIGNLSELRDLLRSGLSDGAVK